MCDFVVGKSASDGSDSPSFDFKRFGESRLHESVIYTSKNMQLVEYVLEQGTPVKIDGLETSDMFLHVESGEVRVETGGKQSHLKKILAGVAIMIPKETTCFVHTPMGELAKFYCIFSPPRWSSSTVAIGKNAPSEHDQCIVDIRKTAPTLTEYRHVVHTTQHMQLVSMAIGAGVDIMDEVHVPDQFFRVETGSITVMMPKKEHKNMKSGTGVIVPGGTRHRVLAGQQGVNMYTLYSPPQHHPNRVDVTRPADD